MNENHNYNKQELLPYQAARLQDLLSEIIQCCQGRMIYQSRRFDLPQAELNCLMLLMGPSYLSVGHIAQKMEVAKSRVTKILDGLEDKGLVQRITDPGDARAKLVSLTPSGHKKADHIAQFLSEVHGELLGQLEPVQRQEVLSSLEVLHASMENVKSKLKI